MVKIPVIGTQSINSISNLKRLIESIDYPTEILSIIINNENFETLIEIKNFCTDNKNPHIDKIEISYHPSNLGCPASWTYHFKQYPKSSFFIKADDDIQFSPGELERMVSEISSGIDMVFYSSSSTKYALFGITKKTLNEVGLFDENLYPCNYGDDDYNIRLKIAGISEKNLTQISYHVGSGTTGNLEDPNFEHGKLSNFLVTTEEYFFKKWGDRFPNNYQFPFNDPKNDIKNISYNFSYRENKEFRCNYYK